MRKLPVNISGSSMLTLTFSQEISCTVVELGPWTSAYRLYYTFPGNREAARRSQVDLVMAKRQSVHGDWQSIQARLPLKYL